jgi:ATP-dependent protease HslVU (ClpYQ) peptidase subunit
MTTIVGMTTLNETWLMVDSCLSIGNMREVSPSKLLVHDSPEGSPVLPFALACAGRLQATQLVFSHIVEEIKKVEFKPGAGGMDFAMVMAATSRTILRDAGIALDQSQYLLALPGQLFAFNDAGDVHKPSRGYYAAGTGEGYALGAMYERDSSLLNSIRAIQAAKEFDLYTQSPFLWARVFTSRQPVASHVETGTVEI